MLAGRAPPSPGAPLTKDTLLLHCLLRVGPLPHLFISGEPAPSSRALIRPFCHMLLKDQVFSATPGNWLPALQCAGFLSDPNLALPFLLYSHTHARTHTPLPSLSPLAKSKSGGSGHLPRMSLGGTMWQSLGLVESGWGHAP